MTLASTPIDRHWSVNDTNAVYALLSAEDLSRINCWCDLRCPVRLCFVLSPSSGKFQNRLLVLYKLGQITPPKARMKHSRLPNVSVQQIGRAHV